MKANCWMGALRLEVKDVPDPSILNPRDARAGRIDPTFIVTHRLPLDDAPEAFETFKHKQDDCVKVVLTPGA